MKEAQAKNEKTIILDANSKYLLISQAIVALTKEEQSFMLALIGDGLLVTGTLKVDESIMPIADFILDNLMNGKRVKSIKTMDRYVHMMIGAYHKVHGDNK